MPRPTTDAAHITTPPTLTTAPWTLAGFSQETWRRYRHMGVTPPPLALPGRPRWRIADVLAWLEALPPAPTANAAASQASAEPSPA